MNRETTTSTEIRDAAPSAAPKPAPAAAPTRQSKSLLRTRVWATTVWSVSCLAVFAVLMAARQSGDEPRTLHLLGLVFAAYVVATRSLAAQAKDISTLAVVLFGAAFGTWFPVWRTEVTAACTGWLFESTGLPPQSLISLGDPVAILTAGAITGAALSVATYSGRVAFYVVVLSLAAGLTCLLPGNPDVNHAGGVLLWHAGVAASLCSWAVTSVKRKKEACCPHCGQDIRGVVEPTCPGCRHPIERVVTVVPPVPQANAPGAATDPQAARAPGEFVVPRNPPPLRRLV